MSARATWVLVSAALAGGCGFHSDAAHPGGDGATAIDAMPDTTAELDDGCLRNSLVTVCLDAEPTADVTLPDGSIDTDHSELCATNARDESKGYCIISGTTITVPANVTVTAQGARPLVFASPGKITIAGIIDIAGHQRRLPQASGPGVVACSAGTAPQASGGGYGGSFGSLGGNGGASSNNDPGGKPLAVTAPTPSSFRSAPRHRGTLRGTLGRCVRRVRGSCPPPIRSTT